VSKIASCQIESNISLTQHYQANHHVMVKCVMLAVPLMLPPASHSSEESLFLSNSEKKWCGFRNAVLPFCQDQDQLNCFVLLQSM